MSLGTGLAKLAGARVPHRPPRLSSTTSCWPARCAASKWGCAGESATDGGVMAALDSLGIGGAEATVLRGSAHVHCWPRR